MLSDMLEGRDKISNDLQKIIDIRTEPWASMSFRWRSRTFLFLRPRGCDVEQAQAERERQARVILGDSEKQVAEKFGEAGRPTVTSRCVASQGNEHAL